MWTTRLVLGITLLSCAKPDPQATFEQARALGGAGRWSEALPVYRRAVKEMRARKSPALPLGLADLATAQLRLGSEKEAKESAQEALALASKLTPEQTPAVLASVSQIMWSTGETKIALESIDRAVEMCEQTKCKSKPALLYIVAGFLEQAGERERAISVFDQIITTCRSATDKEVRGYGALAQAGIAAAYAHAGERAKAEGAFAEAVRAYVEVFGENHPETKSLREDIAAFRKSAQ
jgi:tetratricopeptide (TPR) repeat protein